MCSHSPVRRSSQLPRQWVTTNHWLAAICTPIGHYVTYNHPMQVMLGLIGWAFQQTSLLILVLPSDSWWIVKNTIGKIFVGIPGIPLFVKTWWLHYPLCTMTAVLCGYIVHCCCSQATNDSSVITWGQTSCRSHKWLYTKFSTHAVVLYTCEPTLMYKSSGVSLRVHFIKSLFWSNMKKKNKNLSVVCRFCIQIHKQQLPWQ